MFQLAIGSLTEPYIYLCIYMYTVPFETISVFAHGDTSSLPTVFAAKSPRLEENRKQGKDESNRMPW